MNGEASENVADILDALSAEDQTEEVLSSEELRAYVDEVLAELGQVERSRISAVAPWM